MLPLHFPIHRKTCNYCQLFGHFKRSKIDLLVPLTAFISNTLRFLGSITLFYICHWFRRSTCLILKASCLCRKGHCCVIYICVPWSGTFCPNNWSPGSLVMNWCAVALLTVYPPSVWCAVLAARLPFATYSNTTNIGWMGWQISSWSSSKRIQTQAETQNAMIDGIRSIRCAVYKYYRYFGDSFILMV